MIRRITGYEIFDFGFGIKAWGFGVLEQWGYIDLIPEVYAWQRMSTDHKRKWVVDTNIELDKRSSNGNLWLRRYFQRRPRCRSHHYQAA